MILHLSRLAENKHENRRTWLWPLHYAPPPPPSPIPAPPGGGQPKPSTFVTCSNTGADCQRPRKYSQHLQAARPAQGQDTENPSPWALHGSACSNDVVTTAGAAGPGATRCQTPEHRPRQQGSPDLTGRQGAYSLGPPGTCGLQEGAAASLRDSKGGTSDHTAPPAALALGQP